MIRLSSLAVQTQPLFRALVAEFRAECTKVVAAFSRFHMPLAGWLTQVQSAPDLTWTGIRDWPPRLNSGGRASLSANPAPLGDILKRPRTTVGGATSGSPPREFNRSAGSTPQRRPVARADDLLRRALCRREPHRKWELGAERRAGRADL